MPATATSTSMESNETTNSASKALIMMQEWCNKNVGMTCTEGVPLTNCTV